MISENGIRFVKSVLGDDFFEELEKSEIGSPVGGIVNARLKTAVSPEEVKIALQIVPRTILSYLFANLKHRADNEVFSLDLPFAHGAQILINKKGPDSYSGEITQSGKRLVEYKYRSLPAIGLLLLSTFELYDMSLVDEIKMQTPQESEKTDKIHDMIDERLMMHQFIQDVVDRRISQKEAIDKLVKEKLHSHVMLLNPPQKEEEELMEESKKSKLREFLDNKEKRNQEPVEVEKGEITCPDCATSLYKSGDKGLKLCICYGQFHNKEIKIKKSKNGETKLNFPKKFDIEDIEMLLDAVNSNEELKNG